jgi:hypothetical protein
MDLAHIIALVSSVNADPTTVSDISDEPVVVTTVVGRNIPKASKVKAAPIQDPNAGKSMTPGLALPERNTLDAKSFLLTVRKAKDRNEVIQAIHAYCGYNPSGNFGTQDQEARAKAMRELRGVNTAGPSIAEKKAANRSLAGFVAGMPDPSQRILSNLRARETAAVEAMLAAKTEEEKAAHKVVLSQIQKAIDEMVG